MSDKRRLVIIIISISIGMGVSALLFYAKKQGQPFNNEDYLWMGTNLFFSLLIVIGIGFFFLKKKNKNNSEE